MIPALATRLVSVAAGTTPGATTDFGTISEIPGWCTRLTVEVAVATSSKLYVVFDDGTAQVLNGDTALTANTLYAFTITVTPGEKVEWQLAGAVALRRFLVDGYPGGL